MQLVPASTEGPTRSVAPPTTPFPDDVQGDERQAPHAHLSLFKHVPGAEVCQSLFGHYALPDGTMAHYYHRDEVEERAVVSPCSALLSVFWYS